MTLLSSERHPLTYSVILQSLRGVRSHLGAIVKARFGSFSTFRTRAGLVRCNSTTGRAREITAGMSYFRMKDHPTAQRAGTNARLLPSSLICIRQSGAPVCRALALAMEDGSPLR
jgi:hypothetical protein